jgi:hypothetical protein
MQVIRDIGKETQVAKNNKDGITKYKTDTIRNVLLKFEAIFNIKGLVLKCNYFLFLCEYVCWGGSINLLIKMTDEGTNFHEKFDILFN